MNGRRAENWRDVREGRAEIWGHEGNGRAEGWNVREGRAKAVRT